MITRVITVGLLTIASCALAFGQTSSRSDAKDSPPSATTAKGSAPHRARKAMHQAHDSMHRAKHHDDAAMHGHDRAYRGALRRCVQGPQERRESCLDQAIARYGH